ncbi:MAG: cupin domain-containing protein [Actinomycetota bacterium]|nr:cupin domain-containing protein [Actinomycetota bacterium]
MKVVDQGEVQTVNLDRYSGDVEVRSLRSSVNPLDPDLLRVRYEPGSVTNWHTHPGGQYIYVLENSVLISNDKGESNEVQEGSLVVVQPGERHWHGATRNSSAEILTISFGVTRWEENHGGNL